MPDIPAARNAWGIMLCKRRTPVVLAAAYGTRTEARRDFLKWWSNPQLGELALKNKVYRIVKVRIEVIA